MQSYPVDHTTAREVSGKGYTFDPTGKEIPLFNQPQTEEKLPIWQRRSMYLLPCAAILFTMNWKHDGKN